MKIALLTAFAVALCVLTGEASADRIRLSCEGPGGKNKIELEIDNGVVLKNKVFEPNVINLTVNEHYISYFVDNLAAGGLLEKYVIDLQDYKLNWTGRKFEFVEAATGNCTKESNFLRN
ncbi:MAG: hypothetical protein ACLPX9_02110 [Rhodomicrobium sp.]